MSRSKAVRSEVSLTHTHCHTYVHKHTCVQIHTSSSNYCNTQKLMSWIVTVIWIWLCILTRIHKADSLLWFYEEVKHCRKLNNIVCMADLIRAWHLSCKEKKKSWLLEVNLKIFSPFSSKTSEAVLSKIFFSVMDQGIKMWETFIFFLINNNVNNCHGSDGYKTTLWADSRQSIWVDIGWITTGFVSCCVSKIFL